MQTLETGDLVTAECLAKHFSVQPSTVRCWHRDGRIPGIKLSGRILRFSVRDVVTALNRQQGADPPASSASHSGKAV